MGDCATSIVIEWLERDGELYDLAYEAAFSSAEALAADFADAMSNVAQRGFDVESGAERMADLLRYSLSEVDWEQVAASILPEGIQ